MNETNEHAEIPEDSSLWVMESPTGYGGVSIRTFRDLRVYAISYQLALSVHKLSASFPGEERYSLTDQIRRASRSVPANIAEGWGVRRHPEAFKRHLRIGLGSIHEVMVWLDFAKDFGYIQEDTHTRSTQTCEHIAGMLARLIANWRPMEND